MQSVLDALTGGTGKITSEVAVVRGCALLTTLCRLTSNPPAALRFAIAGVDDLVRRTRERMHLSGHSRTIISNHRSKALGHVAARYSMLSGCTLHSAWQTVNQIATYKIGQSTVHRAWSRLYPDVPTKPKDRR